MNKFIFFSLIIFCSFQSIGQIRGLEEKIDRIATTRQDAEFISTIKINYDNLIREKADSILLFYEVFSNSNYAVLYWKKDEHTSCEAYYQYSPVRRAEIGKESLKNKILEDINILAIYSILKDSAVRMIDTTFMISHNDPVYCQFYFGGKVQFFVGYQAAVSGRIYRLNSAFQNTYVTESNRIVMREMKKYHGDNPD